MQKLYHLVLSLAQYAEVIELQKYFSQILLFLIMMDQFHKDTMQSYVQQNVIRNI